MRIQSTRIGSPTRKAPPPAERAKETLAGETKKARTPWRVITLNEAAVEIPQSLLEMSEIDRASPFAAKGLQAGIAGLALTRAIQCFHDAECLEEYLEGTSSAALAVAGGATLFPAASAGVMSQAFLVGHGATEFALGIREVTEELKKDEPARLELAAGILDTVKGASTFIPLLFPEAADGVNLFQIVAILGKTVMEPRMERSRKDLTQALGVPPSGR